MKKFISSFNTCAALILLCVGVAPRANATPWTFYTSGNINNGTDVTGVFGNSNTDLAGLTYSQTYTLDPTLYQNQIGGNPGDIAHFGNGSLTGTATDTVTVNGVSKTFTLDLSQYNMGQSYLVNYLTQGYPIFDVADQNQEGVTADGTQLTSMSYVYSYANVFNLGLNYDQTWSYTLQVGDVGYDYFNIAGTSGFTTFYGDPNFISINAPIAAVPEPETYAMLLAGLGLMGFARRRKSIVS